MLHKNNEAIQATFEFAVTKGNLPVFLGGDFNVEVEEPEPLKRMKEFLSFGQWQDAAGANQTPTCLKGKNGSTIDFFFLSSTAASLLARYSIRSGLLKKDHQFGTIHMATPLACQHEYRITQSSCQSHFESAPATRTHPEQSFQKNAFPQNQIEDAWGMSSKIANNPRNNPARRTESKNQLLEAADAILEKKSL